MNSVAAQLAAGLLELSARRLPPAIQVEAERSLLNVVATAIGASRQPAVDVVLNVGRQVGGPAVHVVPGRAERADQHHAALATGVAAHLDDFDDTHLQTVIHPGAACLAAGLVVAARRRSSGRHFLASFALGIEAQLRVGAAMSPHHYDEGWHITGTVGVIGAAVTAGLLLGLDARRLEMAVGLAAAQPLGHRESFGTMEKSFHPGKAAAGGMLAALLAESGLTIGGDVLEGVGGYFELLSAQSRPDVVAEALGTRWEILANTYKPYPCGIVCHPAIDAAVALSGWVADAGRVRSVTIHCNPLVAELTGNPTPTDGLEARFSTIHGVAAGLADGKVGLPQYSDQRVRAEDLVRLRSLTRLAPDVAIPRDSARVEVELNDGHRMGESVGHARGSLGKPLTDAELVDKTRGLVDPILPGRTEQVVGAVRGVAVAESIDHLLATVSG